MPTTPRIYLASLSDYTAGRLHGVWVDAVDQDEIHEALAKMLKASKELVAEEWAIHDAEGFYGGFEDAVSEHESLEAVARLGALIAKHGEVAAKLYSHLGRGQLDEVEAALEERYHGAFSSLTDYAESYCEDCGLLTGLTDALRGYFDFESFGRDLELGGDVFTVRTSDGFVHVFSGA